MRRAGVFAISILAGCGAPDAPAPRTIAPLPTSETVIIAGIASDGRTLGTATVPKYALSDEDWRAQLSPLAYSVMRDKATELAFTGRYHKHRAKGVYRCAACRTALFHSSAKFDSGTGWPSFRAPAARENVYTASDGSRDEVLCRRCDSHLGHLFHDGPEPERLRYCVNSAALAFEAAR